MSYRQGPPRPPPAQAGRAPVRYDDVDAAPVPLADRRAPPPPHADRNGYGHGNGYNGREGPRYDRGGRDYERDGYRGGGRGGHYDDRRRSRSPAAASGRGGRPRAYDYDDDYSADRRDRSGESDALRSSGHPRA